ncbi:MAG: hypothetical protein A2Z19_02440 [Deltaproteobacteria bacterium RBG_16_54_18]|jgi:hypothetical protein|nr:MAG: hypothetical protein A2Z19_02440 [Deltaproteobacteria bacterium RBG_16_54_18]
MFPDYNGAINKKIRGMRMYFKLVMEGGHVGAGKSYDMVRYFEGDDIFGVMARTRHIPRLKKKAFGSGIKLIKEISWREYIAGKGEERKDPYLIIRNRHHDRISALAPA